jgi:hypothetical protein
LKRFFLEPTPLKQVVRGDWFFLRKKRIIGVSVSPERDSAGECECAVGLEFGLSQLPNSGETLKLSLHLYEQLFMVGFAWAIGVDAVLAP